MADKEPCKPLCELRLHDLLSLIKGRFVRKEEVDDVPHGAPTEDYSEEQHPIIDADSIGGHTVSDIFYRAGDIVEFNTQLIVAGNLTNSKSLLNFVLTFNKILADDIVGVVFEDVTSFCVRGIDGYITGLEYNNTEIPSDITIDTSKNAQGILVYMQKVRGKYENISVNNTPITVFYTGKIRFVGADTNAVEEVSNGE